MKELKLKKGERVILKASPAIRYFVFSKMIFAIPVGLLVFLPLAFLRFTTPVPCVGVLFIGGVVIGTIILLYMIGSVRYVLTSKRIARFGFGAHIVRLEDIDHIEVKNKHTLVFHYKECNAKRAWEYAAYEAEQAREEQRDWHRTHLYVPWWWPTHNRYIPKVHLPMWELVAREEMVKSQIEKAMEDRNAFLERKARRKKKRSRD